MQPTVIRIKFTPIIRHLEKENAKCCLEIVPDVSCIQNLDTIQWNDEHKFVEYSVPVTYKIILKRNTDKNTAEKLERVYYSCVDLRLLSTNSTMACGDISKVISDNYVLRKFINYESRSSISKVSKNQNDTEICTGLEEQDSLKIEELNKLHVNTLSTKKGTRKTTSRNNVDILPSERNVETVEDKKLSRQICTVTKETPINVSDARNNKDKKRKLTITSICTLNTIDNPVHDVSQKNNSEIRLKYINKSKNKAECKISKITESFTMYRSIYADNNNLPIRNAPRERILPELRVAHFMMTVENEILPLKILLSEIYRKCASLGLVFNSKVFPKTPTANTPRYTEKIKFLNYNGTKPKCNRVVYSIVFEE